MIGKREDYGIPLRKKAWQENAIRVAIPYYNATK